MYLKNHTQIFKRPPLKLVESTILPIVVNILRSRINGTLIESKHTRRFPLSDSPEEEFIKVRAISCAGYHNYYSGKEMFLRSHSSQELFSPSLWIIRSKETLLRAISEDEFEDNVTHWTFVRDRKVYHFTTHGKGQFLSRMIGVVHKLEDLSYGSNRWVKNDDGTFRSEFQEELREKASEKFENFVKKLNIP